MSFFSQKFSPEFGRGLAGFLGGVLLLCAFATWQKLSVGAPLLARGYVVPVAFGGATGFVTSLLLSRARQARLKLQDLNQELERRVEQRTAELRLRNQELERALAEIKRLEGFIPICANCHKIRDDEGYWQKVERYIEDRSDAHFSHSICPDCAGKLYPEIYRDKEAKSKT